MSADGRGPADEERRQLRPYRNVVRGVFALAVFGICGLLMRGIIGYLDRMPSADTFQRPERVDERALRACAVDLDRLGVAIHRRAGELLTERPGLEPAPTRADPFETLETERLRIVARCRLDETVSDPAAAAVTRAADETGELLRALGLQYGRHQKDAVPRSREAQRAIREALELLKAR